MAFSIVSTTRRALAEQWNCSERQIDRLIENGELDAFNIGKRGKRVPLNSIRAYMKRKGTGEPESVEEARITSKEEANQRNA